MEATLRDPSVIALAENLRSQFALCPSCLGRQFASLETGMTNHQRGTLLYQQIKQKTIVPTDSCWLCEGLCDEISHFATIIARSLAEYEYTTFLIGSRIDEELSQKEQQIAEVMKTDYAEPLKMEINRETGKLLEASLNKEVDFTSPDIVAMIDTRFDTVSLQIKSLYIYGRYQKLQRGIPQTRWPCRFCRGRGCRACQYTGKLYETSVEELLSQPLLQQTQGTEEAFHGCGREDIDALMLGSGRPFVLEIKNPKNRSINLSSFTQTINTKNKEKIQVHNLRFSSKEEITRLKHANFRKVYHALLEAEKPFHKEKLKEVAQILPGTTIRQFTPTRVAHRRANMVRERKIYNCELELIEDTIARLKIETDSGTYIKELVSGDNGRTQPNISEMIHIPCKVRELDVMEVKGE